MYLKSTNNIKKYHQQNSFIFRFYVWTPNFVHIDTLGENMKMFSIQCVLFASDLFNHLLHSFACGKNLKIMHLSKG